MKTEQEKELEKLGYRKHQTDEKGRTSYYQNGRSLQATGITVTEDNKVKPYSR